MEFGDFEHIFDGIGENFAHLKNLLVKESKIKFVERENFKNLQNLQKLSLLHNQIEFLPEDVFWDLPNLVVLNVGGNKLKQVPEKLFFNLKNLEQIWLHLNKVSKFPRNLFADNLKLKIINSDSNPGNLIRDVDFSRIPCVFINSHSFSFYETELEGKYFIGQFVFKSFPHAILVNSETGNEMYKPNWYCAYWSE